MGESLFYPSASRTGTSYVTSNTEYYVLSRGRKETLQNETVPVIKQTNDMFWRLCHYHWCYCIGCLRKRKDKRRVLSHTGSKTHSPCSLQLVQPCPLLCIQFTTQDLCHSWAFMCVRWFLSQSTPFPCQLLFWSHAQLRASFPSCSYKTVHVSKKRKE
jgi:hypothetical protein